MQHSIGAAWHCLIMTCHALSLSVSRLPIGKCRCVYAFVFFFTRPQQTFGDKTCHPEPFALLRGKLREGSGWPHAEILRFARDDSRDTTHIRSRDVLSPNVCDPGRMLDLSQNLA